MNKGTLLFFIKTTHRVHKLHECLLLGLKLLEFCLGVKVQNSDQSLEFVRFSINIFQEQGIQVLLVIEFGDFSLLVSLGAIVIIPALSGQLFEELELGLSIAGRWIFRPLGEIERQSEKLLLVGRVKVHLLDLGFVLCERHSELVFDLLVRAESWQVLRLYLVDKLLKLIGVTICLLKLFLVAEGDVFETVNFTEMPENRVQILALTLDTEDIRQVSGLRDAFDHMVKELWLGKRVLVVHGEMVEQLVLG